MLRLVNLTESIWPKRGLNMTETDKPYLLEHDWKMTTTNVNLLSLTKTIEFDRMKFFFIYKAHFIYNLLFGSRIVLNVMFYLIYFSDFVRRLHILTSSSVLLNIYLLNILSQYYDIISEWLPMDQISNANKLFNEFLMCFEDNF